MTSLLVDARPSTEETPLEAVMARAREAWERAGRPGAAVQLELLRGDGRPSCVVCGDRGCEHCPAVRP